MDLFVDSRHTRKSVHQGRILEVAIRDPRITQGAEDLAEVMDCLLNTHLTHTALQTRHGDI